jgi:hypothetical protein
MGKKFTWTEYNKNLTEKENQKLGEYIGKKLITEIEWLKESERRERKRVELSLC